MQSKQGDVDVHKKSAAQSVVDGEIIVRPLLSNTLLDILLDRFRLASNVLGDALTLLFEALGRGRDWRGALLPLEAGQRRKRTSVTHIHLALPPQAVVRTPKSGTAA